MKIAFSSTGPGLEDLLDPRFARCRYYLVVDMARNETVPVENTSGMACTVRGTAAGNLVVGLQVDAVITGHIGRKASKTLREAGIRVYLGASGRISAALEDFKAGRLREAE